ncbi:Hint domain-containing protein [Roseivivax sp. CAU 1753]
MSAFFSEIYYEGNAPHDFIEIAAPAGTDTSGWTVEIYKDDGTVSQSLDLGSVVSTTAGKDVYLIDNNTTGFTDLGATKGYALVDGTGTVVQFISFSSSITAVDGAAAGQTADQLGDLTASGQSMESTDGGNTYSAQSSPNAGTVPCYAPGTLIDTPDGPRAVELLCPGDLVLTADHGPQEIRWVRSGDHPLEDVEVESKPVLIAAGALGKGLPAQDLIVSPQHRILVGGGGQLTRYFDTKAFAPAKALTKLPGIRHMKGKTKITWIHFACDRHEVVTANGCLSESLLLGPMVVNGLTRAERRVLIDIFGPVTQPGAALNGTAAFTCLKVGEVRHQIANGATAKHTSAAAREIRKWDVDAAMERYEAERLRDEVRASQTRQATAA